jgi:very-short-patch-repair endonuclease
LRGAGVCHSFKVGRKIIPYNRKLKEFARKLRNDSTLGEILLWKEISGKQMYGYDFHRQKPLLNYIVDFYCYELDLVIEIDGQYHNWEEKSLADQIRDKELEAYNLTILRFTEQEVRKDMINVLRAIEDHILEHTSFKTIRTENFD